MLFDDQITDELENAGLIYGGAKNAHFRIALISDGSGRLHKDRIELSPSQAGSLSLLRQKLDVLGYQYDTKADSLVVYEKARTKVRA